MKKMPCVFVREFYGHTEASRLRAERADRRHPIAALVRHIDDGDVPIAWVMQHEARWSEIWARARLRDRVDLMERVDPRLNRHAAQWSWRIADRAWRADAKEMAAEPGGTRSPVRMHHGYGGDGWPMTAADHNALGWIYRRHIAAPTIAACIAAARAKR